MCKYVGLILIGALFAGSLDVLAQEETFSLEEAFLFTEAEVELASGVEESIYDAPAAMVIVTAEDIQQRGYTNLAEIIMDLPGFDFVLANGIPYLYAYQRGYRTPSTQRTLLMIDGQIDKPVDASGCGKSEVPCFKHQESGSFIRTSFSDIWSERLFRNH